MKWIILFSLAGIIVVGLAGFAGWIFSLPPTVAPAPTAVPAAETAAVVEALHPPKRARPVVAVIGINDATETLDYLMATGILRRADVADVYLVATGEGPVKLYPALQVEPDMTIAEFDAATPDGADYVIVPAMSRDDDPAVMAWLKAQAGKGSIVIGVCAGAKVVAAAGLLENRKGTTHWYYKRDLLKREPSVTLVADRRFVVDGPIATTTGITASMPFALTLIEAIAGHQKAGETAASLGVAQWDARHDSKAFVFSRQFATTVLANTLAFWQRETFTLHIAPGFDAVSLALAANAWSRTYRSQAFTIADSAPPVPDVTGIRIVPDRVGSTPGNSLPIELPRDATPAAVLDTTLAAVGQRYGDATENVVAMQLEYDGPDPSGGA